MSGRPAIEELAWYPEDRGDASASRKVEDALHACAWAWRPCLVRGGAKDLPAFDAWHGPSGRARMSQLAGPTHVSVMVSPSGDPDFSGVSKEHGQTWMDLATYFSTAIGGDGGGEEGAARKRPRRMALYLAQADIYDRDRPEGSLAGLQEDLRELPFVPWRERKAGDGAAGGPADGTKRWSPRLQAVNLWMTSSEGSTGSVHYDNWDNVLAVLSGRKRVTLAAPNDSSIPHRKVWEEDTNHSTSDPEDFCRDRVAVQVNAGDALYIPEGWWHCVASDPETIAVNFWYDSFQVTTAESSMEYLVRRGIYAAMMKEQKAAFARIPIATEITGVDGMPPRRCGGAEPLPPDRRALTDAERRAVEVLVGRRKLGVSMSCTCWEGHSTGCPLTASAPGIVLRSLGPAGCLRVVYHLARESGAGALAGGLGRLLRAWACMDHLVLTELITEALSLPEMAGEATRREFTDAFHGALASEQEQEGTEGSAGTITDVIERSRTLCRKTLAARAIEGI